MLSFFKSKNKNYRIGLCLSEHSLSLVLIDLVNKKTPRIKNSFHYEFSSTEEGLDVARQQLIHFVEQNGLKNIDCYCVLSKEDYQLLLVEPPEVPESELLDAMKWKVKDLANVDIEKTVIDIFPQPENKMLYAVVAEKTVIVRLIDLVKNAGLLLTAIDIEELSYRNFFCNRMDGQDGIEDRGLAVISIYKNEGHLLILKDGNIFLSRQFSINYGAGVFDDIPEDEVILELQRSLDYYERQMRQPAPAEIIFCGDIDDEKITPLIRDSFQQKIRCADMSPMLGEHQLQMAPEAALKLSGAALRLKAAS